MLKIEFSGQFKKDYRLAIKRGFDLKHLEEAVALPATEQPLPPCCRDYALRSSHE